MVSQAELISKGYHSLVPGLISIFLQMVWVPLSVPIRASTGRISITFQKCHKYLFLFMLSGVQTFKTEGVIQVQ